MTDSRLVQCFRDKTVLITGHTGFKGSWLSIWLHLLGARVIGISDSIPTNPANFSTSNVAAIVDDHRHDIRDATAVKQVINGNQPDFVFHLAAQAIVKESYSAPLDTLNTNILGTANILEAIRVLQKPCIAIMITSDKCYDNVEWEWGYRETDPLGGKDPYSASKGAAELIIRTYAESFFRNSNIRVGVGRAGNVIGGGDWARFRLVPDCIRSWANNEAVTIANPASTRPWQLVLEPLSGYLSLAMALSQSQNLHGEAFNFGPVAENNYSVRSLIEEMEKYWTSVEWRTEHDSTQAVYEAGLLKLNCDKALHHLHWRPTYNFHETVEATMSWYRDYYDNGGDMLANAQQQLIQYQSKAKDLGIGWAQ